MLPLPTTLRAVSARVKMTSIRQRIERMARNRRWMSSVEMLGVMLLGRVQLRGQYLCCSKDSAKIGSEQRVSDQNEMIPT